MPWPELLKARKNAGEIEAEIERLLREHRALSKKEVSRQKDTILAEVDAAMGRIDEGLAELRRNLRSHRTYVEAKQRFLRRHYKRLYSEANK